MKKLLATTALVSVIAAPVLAETKIAGSLETTFGDKETPATTSPASKGAALGHEVKVEFISTKELNNGWSATLDLENMEVNDGFADTEVTISNGAGLSLYISKDGGSFHDWTVVPGAYNARPVDNVSNDSATMDVNTIHGVHNLGFGYKTDFGTFGFRYAPDHQASNTAGDKVAGAGGGSGHEYGFLGSLGVEGLSVGISKAVKQNEQTNGKDDADSTHYGVAYNMGQFAFGVERTTFSDKNNSDNDSNTTTNDVDYTLYGVTYAASDNLTLGLNLAVTDEESTANKEETTQLEVAYNLGGATVAFAHQTTEDNGGTAGSDADAWTITYKQSF
jgi:hypothetical protein